MAQATIILSRRKAYSVGMHRSVETNDKKPILHAVRYASLSTRSLVYSSTCLPIIMFISKSDKSEFRQKRPQAIFNFQFSIFN
jgi:hypothetical protein